MSSSGLRTAIEPFPPAAVSGHRTLVREFLVHLALDQYWRGGEWFDVRDLALEHPDGWAGVIADAAASALPGPAPHALATSDGAHALTSMRHNGSEFVLSCSCGDEVKHAGRLPKGVLRFTTAHLRINWVRPVMRHRGHEHDRFSET